MRNAPGDDALLRDIAIAEIGRAPARAWSIADEDFWCRIAPVGGVLPAQGWKLHVSATMLSAPVVLSRVVRVLSAEGCAFKFPARLDDYWELLMPHCPRAQAGKFVTVYPADDVEAARLAALLDEATWGLPGPAILSDRPWRPGGIVHYRYGTFGGHRVLGNDGFYELRIRTPEGRAIPDERLPRFSPPSFATSPFAAFPAATSAGPSTPGISTAGASTSGASTSGISTSGASTSGVSTSDDPAGGARPSGTRDGTGSGNGNGNGRPAPAAVMLNGRFVVREAVRHANRGGVYLARDDVSGAEVVIKEGRPHASSDLAGHDARSRLATERSRLKALAGTGLVPAVVDFFEQGGHVFLVEEHVPGTTLRRWSEENAGPVGHDGFGHGPAEILPIVRRLVEALRAVHACGYVFRDLSPDNVMILPGGDLRLIDPEHVAAPGEIVMIGGTPGYLAPELVPYGGRFRPAPGREADLFGLGGLVYFLAVGAGLELPEDGVTGPARGRRLLDHVAAVSASNPALALLRPLVEGLVTEPERRWPLDRCTAYLAGLATDRTPPPDHPPVADRTPVAGHASIADHPSAVDRAPVADRPPVRTVTDGGADGGVDDLVADGLAWLVETADTSGQGPSPWPGVQRGVEADPCSVNGGVPGILGVLTLASRAPHDTAKAAKAARTAKATETAGPAGVAELAELAAGVTRWLRGRLAAEDLWPPGLYFGRSGAVWALYDAAEAAGDGETMDVALRAAARLPVAYPNSDVTHGLAGAGMAVLRLAVRSGDPVLRERAARTFENLHAARSYRRGQPRWPVPESFDSGLAGADHLGFAHGIAGIGTALLYGAVALDRPEWMATVREVAAALEEHADVDGDCAWWPTLAEEPRTLRPRRPHWCSGSSGIGSFLVRYWRATGEAGALRLARQAAVAAHRTRWQTGTVPCHGLPGEGEFLLDMAAFTGEDRYLRQAGDLAGCLRARAVSRSGRTLVPDPFSTVVPTFLGGTAGVVAFLLRLRHGHARPWMLDDVMGDAWRSPLTGSPPAPGRWKEKRPAAGVATRSTGR
ncbi:class IV lanthionine synthetase LanL [Streptosporangium longisporum]|uniref:class IV lanthionine synthetase LanL n=1 Tax=Streptosporangium longisporum TaxID=46187 RepID=UPI0031E5E5BE